MCFCVCVCGGVCVGVWRTLGWEGGGGLEMGSNQQQQGHDRVVCFPVDQLNPSTCPPTAGSRGLVANWLFDFHGDRHRRGSRGLASDCPRGLWVILFLQHDHGGEGEGGLVFKGGREI